jgi:hypothetical protein
LVSSAPMAAFAALSLLDLALVIGSGINFQFSRANLRIGGGV